MFANMKKQQKNEDSHGTSAGVDKDIEKSAGTFGDEILMNFIADGVKHTGDKGNINFFDIKGEMNRSEKAKAERGVFAEMGELSQKIVRDDISQIVYYHRKQTFADLFGFNARVV